MKAGDLLELIKVERLVTPLNAVWSATPCKECDDKIYLTARVFSVGLYTASDRLAVCKDRNVVIGSTFEVVDFNDEFFITSPIGLHAEGLNTFHIRLTKSPTIIAFKRHKLMFGSQI